VWKGTSDLRNNTLVGGEKSNEIESKHLDNITDFVVRRHAGWKHPNPPYGEEVVSSVDICSFSLA
jgi:hypothetical protein